MRICKNLCTECPFSNQSLKGFLADYSIQDIKNIFDNDILFPCHIYLQNDIFIEHINEKVLSGEYPLCRGYAECMIKSAKSPRSGELRRLLIQQVRDNLSDNSMTIWEFMEHHDLSKISNSK